MCIFANDANSRNLVRKHRRRKYSYCWVEFIEKKFECCIVYKNIIKSEVFNSSIYMGFGVRHRTVGPNTNERVGRLRRRAVGFPQMTMSQLDIQSSLLD